jgi:diaminopimelate decarboxylase
VLLEPGRSLVGNAGVLLTEVLYTKPSEAKNFCVVDAAMNDLVRPAMYEAWMAIEPCVQRAEAPARWDVVGPVCESGDWLGRDRSLAVHSGRPAGGALCRCLRHEHGQQLQHAPAGCRSHARRPAVHLIREREDAPTCLRANG